MDEKDKKIAHLSALLDAAEVANRKLRQEMKAARAKVNRLENYFQSDFDYINKTGNSAPE